MTITESDNEGCGIESHPVDTHDQADSHRPTSRGGVTACTDGGRYKLICESCRRGGHACENYVFAAEMGGRCECETCQPRCDNYSPPITCLTAPTSTTGRCDQCRTRTARMLRLPSADQRVSHLHMEAVASLIERWEEDDGDEYTRAQAAEDLRCVIAAACTCRALPHDRRCPRRQHSPPNPLA